MKCQFALFKGVFSKGSVKYFRVWQPPARRDCDVGYSLPEEGELKVYTDYFSSFLDYYNFPVFSLLKFFPWQRDCFIEFLPLSCPSPTSFKDGKYFGELFDNLLGSGKSSYYIIMGCAIHECIQQSLVGEDLQKTFANVYFGDEYFKNCPSEDIMTEKQWDTCLSSCKSCCDRLRQYNCSIENEKHITSEVLSCEGRIDIYGSNNAMQLVVELKSRYNKYNEANYHKQVALYIYQEIQEDYKYIYCDIVGILENYKSPYYPNGEKYVEQSLFTQDSYRQNGLLINYLNILVQQRNLYLLCMFMLEEYISLKEPRPLISKLFHDMSQQQNSEDDLRSCLFVMERYEKHEFLQEDFMLLQREINEVVENDVNNMQFLKSVTEQLKSFDEVYQAQIINLSDDEIITSKGIRKYAYRTTLPDGTYRLFELDGNKVIRRCQIFGYVNSSKLTSSIELSVQYSYLSLLQQRAKLKGIFGFDFNEPRCIDIKSYQKATDRYVVVSDDYLTIEQQNAPVDISESSDARGDGNQAGYTGDYERDRNMYYLAGKNNYYLSPGAYVGAWNEYKECELFVDGKMAFEELMFCCLTRSSVHVFNCTQRELDDIIQRATRNGINLASKAGAAVVDLCD